MRPQEREMKEAREQKVTNWVPRGRGPPLGWGEALALEVEVTMTPTATKVVPVDTRKTGGGLDRTGVAEVVEAHQTIQTQEGEMDSIRGSEEDMAPEATQGHRAPKDLGDLQDQPDRKGTRGRSQGLET